MWKMFRTARANLLRDSLDSSLETSWKINDISKNENGNPIEINGLINSKSNETQMKTKWASIEAILKTDANLSLQDDVFSDTTDTNSMIESKKNPRGRDPIRSDEL